MLDQHVPAELLVLARHGRPIPLVDKVAEDQCHQLVQFAHQRVPLYVCSVYVRVCMCNMEKKIQRQFFLFYFSLLSSFAVFCVFIKKNCFF